MLQETTPEVHNIVERCCQSSRLHGSAKLIICNAVNSVIDDFLSHLLTQTGYRCSTTPNVADSIAAVGVLWRTHHLHYNALLEFETEEIGYNESLDSDYGSVDAAEDAQSTAESEDDHSLVDDDELSAEEDEEEAAFDNDLSFDSPVGSVDNQDMSSLSAGSDDSVARIDRLSQYLQSIARMKLRSELKFTVDVTRVLEAFLTTQLICSFNNNNESFFCRAGYPPFGMLNQLLLNEEEATHARAFAALLHEQAEQSTILRDEQLTNVRLLTTLEEFVAMIKGQKGEGEGGISQEADKENMQSAVLRSPPASSSSAALGTFRSPTDEMKTPKVHHQSVVRDLENGMVELTSARTEVETLRAQLKAEREGRLLLQHKQRQLKKLIGRLNDVAEDVMVSDEMDVVDIPLSSLDDLTNIDKKQSKKRGRRTASSRSSTFEQNSGEEEEGDDSAEVDKPSNKRRRSQFQAEEQPVMMLTRPQPVNREEVETLRQGRAQRQSLGPHTPSLFDR